MKTVIQTEPEKIEAIIRRCNICFVGMVDANNIPYVIPMNFGYDEGIVYLHSAQEGTHVDMICNNPNVCIVFNTDSKLVYQHPEVACSYRMRAETVIGWGKVVFEEDYDRKVDALNILMRNYSERKFTYSKPSILNTKIWRVKLDRVSCREFGVPHK